MAFEPHGLNATWMGRVQGPDITAMAVSEGSGSLLYMIKFLKNSGIIMVLRRDSDAEPYQEDDKQVDIPQWTLIFTDRITTPHVLSSTAERIKEDMCNHRS